MIETLTTVTGTDGTYIKALRNAEIGVYGVEIRDHDGDRWLLSMGRSSLVSFCQNTLNRLREEEQ